VVVRPRVLVVDDEPKVVEACRLYLEHAGFEVAVAFNGAQALDEVALHPPALVVLDVLLPRLDGREVLRRLRGSGSRVPVLLLTALTAEADRIEGLDAGADDYLSKPFSPRELVARVRAVLRRAPESADDGVVVHGVVRIDPARRGATCAGQSVSLSPREYDLLLALARAGGRVLSRAELLDRAFGADRAVLERTVDVHVRNLRRKLEPDPAAPRLIRTVPGAGYRLDGGGA
jgi:DNA-binding response OmpR family regulator